VHPAGGPASLRHVLAGTLARLGPAAVLAVMLVVAAGLLARAAPLPEYGTGFAIIDEQMRRSHQLGETDVLLLGDSATLYGVDPQVVSAGLGDARVESLAAIGPVRPPGYVKLFANHLAHRPSPPLALLILHPLGLMDALPAHKRGEMRAVLHDGWERSPFMTGARQGINRWLFGGFLEEPLEGAHGRLYGNARLLGHALRSGRGGLANPLTVPLATPPAAAAQRGAEYVLHADGRRDLEAAGTLLQGVDTSRLYVGMAPVPASLATEPEARSRAELLTATLALLGLPPDHAVALPRSLPNAEFVDFTHLGAAGRRRYSEELVPLLGALRGAVTPD
jgi:hypothetical protein